MSSFVYTHRACSNVLGYPNPAPVAGNRRTGLDITPLQAAVHHYYQYGLALSTHKMLHNWPATISLFLHFSQPEPIPHLRVYLNAARVTPRIVWLYPYVHQLRYIFLPLEICIQLAINTMHTGSPLHLTSSNCCGE